MSKNLESKVEKVSTKPKQFRLDLRIQQPSALGAISVRGIESATALVRLAKGKRLDMIAVADYNSVGFVSQLKEAAELEDVKVLPAVSLKIAEPSMELLLLFKEDEDLSTIASLLSGWGIKDPYGKNEEAILKVPLAEIITKVETVNGSVIPSRVDRTPTGVQLINYLIEDLGFRTFDLAFAETGKKIKSKWKQHKFNFLTFSNAASLAQVGSRSTKLKLPGLSYSSIKDMAARA